MLSSTEAEHIAMAGTVKDGFVVRHISTLMRPGVKLKTVAIYDNSGAVHLANNLMDSAGSKNIDIHQYICDIVNRGDIKIVHVKAKLQNTDFLTKKKKMVTHIENIGGM